MSKVIPNHIVRVGQTICVSSQEEHACLQHPAGCLSSHTLPAQYLYYSVQGWDRQSAMAQAKGCSLPSSELYAPCKPVTEVMPVAPPDLQEAPTEARQGTCSVSPTLDVSIEDLNRLILEIDPTFQPLQLKPAHTQSPVQTIPPSDPAVPQKKEADSPDIKYIEMSPARAKGAESWQNPAGSSSTSLSVSPRLLPCGGTPRNTCDMGGPMAFVHAHDLGGLPATGRQPPMCTQVSESISIPQRGQKNSAAHGSDSHLASSPGFENFLKLAHHGRLAQRCSEASMLSTSPGSDTSYVLGSSTQSLSSGVPDTPPTRSTGSLSSVGSLNGSYDGICSSSSYHPSVLCSQKGNSSLPQPPQKGQTHNGSPPVANSSPQIPIVLINGRLEDSEAFSRPPQVHPSSFRHKIPQPNSGVFSGAGGSNKTSSESSLSSISSVDSWSKDTQPTMKFVMDTSKYWFKPTITRDEAVQLLTDKLPGTFIMRDSTSYRGSFGLAMKVFSSKTGEDGGDHIRHFLIESSARGVHLKGADEEPYFGSLSAFVYQHTIMPLALPCKLVIPSQDFIGGQESPTMSAEITPPVSQKFAACNLLFLHSMTMETLTGKAAIQKAVSSAFELEVLPTPTIVHFKVTEQGITLTDIQRKVFFRRHYPLATISFCEMDPENRKWQKFSRTSRIFGVVAKSPADSENVCHLFAEYDAVHPASHVVDFIKKLLPAA
ncbi:Tensin-4 [Varanus komodoensis]|uniref:tensin-4 n=1 Tax=Varanus komodoensis TaxID=61221 RepID=UPI001CF7902E|nr:tensin-4 [Varanus komodoensis]KAF7239112.1 Tensin-4 [Varanus komodoensis]